MKIQIESPTKHTGAIIMEEDELLSFHNAITKLIPYIEENKNLGFASKKRLNVSERDIIIDFTQRLNRSINYINDNNESQTKL